MSDTVFMTDCYRSRHLSEVEPAELLIKSASDLDKIEQLTSSRQLKYDECHDPRLLSLDVLTLVVSDEFNDIWMLSNGL